MARKYGKVLCAMWTDDDFRTLSGAAQRLYILAFSQPNISNCGVVPFTVKRWARYSNDSTIGAVQAAVDELATRGYVILDDETEELLIRSFVKHDGILEVPNLVKSMWSDLAKVESGAVRNAILEGFTEGFPEPFPDGFDKRLLEPSRNGMAIPAPTSTPSSFTSSQQEPEPDNGSRPAAVTGAAAAKVSLALDEVVLIRKEQDQHKIHNEAGWMKSTAPAIRKEHAPKVVATATANPEWSPGQIARHVLGITNTRREPSVGAVNRDEEYIALSSSIAESIAEKPASVAAGITEDKNG